MLCHHERCDGRDHRCSERGPAHGAVRTVVRGGNDADSRRCEIDLRTEGRERRKVAGGIGRGDGDGAGARRREVWAPRPAVPGRGDNERAAGVCVAHCVAEAGCSRGAAEREVDHAGAVIDRPDDPRRHLEIGANPSGVQHLDRKHARIPRASGDADAVVRRRGGDAGDRGSVSDERVVASIGIAPRDERAAREELRGQIGDRRDPGVDDGDDEAG